MDLDGGVKRAGKENFSPTSNRLHSQFQLLNTDLDLDKGKDHEKLGSDTYGHTGPR